MVLIALWSLYLLSADFSICAAKDAQNYPRIAVADGKYFVFWADTRHGSDYAVYGTRITAGQKVLDGDGKLLFKHKAAYEPAVATDGKTILVAFRNGC